MIKLQHIHSDKVKSVGLVEFRNSDFNDDWKIIKFYNIGKMFEIINNQKVYLGIYESNVYEWNVEHLTSNTYDFEELSYKQYLRQVKQDEYIHSLQKPIEMRLPSFTDRMIFFFKNPTWSYFATNFLVPLIVGSISGLIVYYLTLK